MAKKTSDRNVPLNVATGELAQRAYEIWQREGCPDGRAMAHWLQAEGELAAASRDEIKNIPHPPEITKTRAPRRSTSRLGEKQFQMAGR